MFFEEMELNVFYVMNNGFVVISNHIGGEDEDDYETDVINSMCKTNGKKLSKEEYEIFGRMMEELIDDPKKYTFELYEGSQELLEKHFGYCFKVEKNNNKFYGYEE